MEKMQELIQQFVQQHQAALPAPTPQPGAPCYYCDKPATGAYLIGTSRGGKAERDLCDECAAKIEALTTDKSLLAEWVAQELRKPPRGELIIQHPSFGAQQALWALSAGEPIPSSITEQVADPCSSPAESLDSAVCFLDETLNELRDRLDGLPPDEKKEVLHDQKALLDHLIRLVNSWFCLFYPEQQAATAADPYRYRHMLQINGLDLELSPEKRARILAWVYEGSPRTLARDVRRAEAMMRDRRKAKLGLNPHLTCAQANAEVMNALRRSGPGVVGGRVPTARELAKVVGCSVGLIAKTPVWRKLQEKYGKPRSPRAVRFTDKLEHITGQVNDPLAKLIAGETQRTSAEQLSADSVRRREQTNRKSVRKPA